VTGTIFIISVSGEVDPESVLWSSTIHLVWTPPHWLHIPPTERLRRKIKKTWKNKNAYNTKNNNICRLFGEGPIEKTRKTLEK
jgi:transposase